MKIAITGGTGNVGRQALDALSDHDLTAMARSDPGDLDVELVELDVADRERFREAVSGHDVLLHLAANPSPDAEWDDVVEPNVEGVYNAYEAARINDVDRVVFASTNHVANMYNAADPAEPESTRADPRTVAVDDPPRPDSYYAVTKVFGEAMGAYYAERYGMEVLNLRIGWLLEDDHLRETQDGREERARYARAMYLSPRDCRNAIRAAVTAPIDESPLSLNVVSRNDDRFFSIVETAARIGYRPRDNSAEALE